MGAAGSAELESLFHESPACGTFWRNRIKSNILFFSSTEYSVGPKQEVSGVVF